MACWLRIVPHGRESALSGEIYRMYPVPALTAVLDEVRSLPIRVGAAKAAGKEDDMNVLSVSVVICAHSEERWDDTLAAAASVLAQSHTAKELIVVVDHSPHLYQ